MAGLPHAMIGEVSDSGVLQIMGIPRPMTDDESGRIELVTPLVIEADIAQLKTAWQKPLNWQ